LGVHTVWRHNANCSRFEILTLRGPNRIGIVAAPSGPSNNAPEKERQSNRRDGHRTFVLVRKISEPYRDNGEYQDNQPERLGVRPKLPAEHMEV
jgi:hypothetical protein